MDQFEWISMISIHWNTPKGLPEMSKIQFRTRFLLACASKTYNSNRRVWINCVSTKNEIKLLLLQKKCKMLFSLLCLKTFNGTYLNKIQWFWSTETLPRGYLKCPKFRTSFLLACANKTHNSKQRVCIKKFLSTQADIKIAKCNQMSNVPVMQQPKTKSQHTHSNTIYVLALHTTMLASKLK